MDDTRKKLGFFEAVKGSANGSFYCDRIKLKRALKWLSYSIIQDGNILSISNWFLASENLREIAVNAETCAKRF